MSTLCICRECNANDPSGQYESEGTWVVQGWYKGWAVCAACETAAPDTVAAFNRELENIHSGGAIALCCSCFTQLASLDTVDVHSRNGVVTNWDEQGTRANIALARETMAQMNSGVNWTVMRPQSCRHYELLDKEISLLCTLQKYAAQSYEKTYEWLGAAQRCESLSSACSCDYWTCSPDNRYTLAVRQVPTGFTGSLETRVVDTRECLACEQFPCVCRTDYDTTVVHKTFVAAVASLVDEYAVLVFGMLE